MGRYLKRIPANIKQMLQNTFGKKLKSIQGRELGTLHKRITEEIRSRYHSKESYKAYISSQKKGHESEFFSYRSFVRYFAGGPIHTDKLNSLLFYLGYEPYEFEHIINQESSGEESSYTNLLQGCWIAFFYDPLETKKGNVKCVSLWLTEKAKNTLKVTANSLWGMLYGNAKVLNNSITFELERDDIRVYLCSELPGKGMRGASDSWILNAGCIVNGVNGRPIMTNVILVKNDDNHFEGLDKLNDKEIITMEYNDMLNHQRDEGAESQQQEAGKRDKTPRYEHPNEIIAYLFRKSRQQTITPFLPNTFNEIRKRNKRFEKEHGRENYDRLKARLKIPGDHSYFAFNRHRPNLAEIAIYSYTFEFRDPERVCIASRHRIGQPDLVEFTGEVVMENEKIYMSLVDADSKRRKHLIANFATESDQANIIKAITSTVSANNAQILGLRELIIDLPQNILKLEEEERTKGYISYHRFLKLPEEVLRPEDRLYLADRTQCTVSYPNPENPKLVYVRQNKARSFKGTYQVFISNTYQKETPSLRRMILHIDELAQVTFDIEYPFTHKINTHRGMCEFYSSNLKVEVQLPTPYTSEQKSIVFLFDHIREAHRLPDLYTGLLLDTDDDNKACTFSFIAINNESLKNKLGERLAKNTDGEIPAPMETPVFNPRPGIIALSAFRQIISLFNSMDENDIRSYFWEMRSLLPPGNKS